MCIILIEKIQKRLIVKEKPENKSTLSANETNEFRKILNESFEKNNVISKPVFEDLSFFEIIQQMDKNRDSLADTFIFNEEEKMPLIPLRDYFNDIDIKFICFHFIFTVIDHKFIVEETMTQEDAITSKILFILGITDFKDFRDHSNKTPLYDIIFILKDYNYFAYNTVLNRISAKYTTDVNDKFATLGSLLNPTAHDTKRKYNSSSMHVDLKLRRLRPPNKTSMYISDEYAETEEFKKIYDFYYRSKVKKVFEAIIEENKKHLLKDKIEKSKEKVEKAKTTKMKSLMEKYNSDMKSKLQGLKNTTDWVY